MCPLKFHLYFKIDVFFVFFFYVHGKINSLTSNNILLIRVNKPSSYFGVSVIKETPSILTLWKLLFIFSKSLVSVNRKNRRKKKEREDDDDDDDDVMVMIMKMMVVMMMAESIVAERTQCA